MILFPNAKINIGLNVVEKRNDGFHELETIFFPVCLTDVLEISKTSASSKDKIALSLSGIKVDGEIKNNLAFKAYELLDKEYNLAPIKAHLHKSIPMGAGLGGGSADAAYMLSGLNDLFDLDISEDRLEHYAARLGSDCAFFIRNTPAIASGRGEILEPIKVDLEGLYIVIVIPNVQVNTKEAYQNIVPKKPKFDLTESIDLNIESWKNRIFNDFEEPIFTLKPEIKEVKENLIKAGAIYACMSGSGSSVYGIFREKPAIKEMLQKDYFTWYSKI